MARAFSSDMMSTAEAPSVWRNKQQFIYSQVEKKKKKEVKTQEQLNARELL